ncbi:hypothetical protein INR49_029842 [Caranx melampygus]|nr:hypothetical protein INR49_029842 [Caranx melampygus]
MLSAAADGSNGIKFGSIMTKNNHDQNQFTLVSVNNVRSLYANGDKIEPHVRLGVPQSALELAAQPMRECAPPSPPSLPFSTCNFIAASRTACVAGYVWGCCRLLRLASKIRHKTWTGFQPAARDQEQSHRWSFAHVFFPLARGPKLTVLQLCRY